MEGLSDEFLNLYWLELNVLNEIANHGPFPVVLTRENWYEQGWNLMRTSISVKNH